MSRISRRKFVTTGLVAAAGASGLVAAAGLAHRYGLIPPDSGGIFGPGETLTYAAQRLLTRNSLAREFPRSMISKPPFANEVEPLGDAFKNHEAAGFTDWRISVDGMVARPGSLSLSDLRSFPVRSQITEVVCEEGWSYIAEWIGTPLVEVLNASGLLPQVRYIVYYSIQPNWWESIDMADALHPQTLLTYAMNDGVYLCRLAARFGCVYRANSATRASSSSPVSRPPTPSSDSAKVSVPHHLKVVTPGTLESESRPSVDGEDFLYCAAHSHECTPNRNECHRLLTK